jgi:hypothetical protein
LPVLLQFATDLDIAVVHVDDRTTCCLASDRDDLSGEGLEAHVHEFISDCHDGYQDGYPAELSRAAGRLDQITELHGILRYDRVARDYPQGHR